jgi:hypothetical protein
MRLPLPATDPSGANRSQEGGTERGCAEIFGRFGLWLFQFGLGYSNLGLATQIWAWLLQSGLGYSNLGLAPPPPGLGLITKPTRPGRRDLVVRVCIRACGGHVHRPCPLDSYCRRYRILCHRLWGFRIRTSRCGGLSFRGDDRWLTAGKWWCKMDRRASNPKHAHDPSLTHQVQKHQLPKSGRCGNYERVYRRCIAGKYTHVKSVYYYLFACLRLMLRN